MNPNNYCTLSAAQRLHEAGIVMKTDFTWGCQVNKDGSKRWTIQPIDCHFVNTEPEYPAPSMAEVWRELKTSNVSIVNDSGLSYAKITAASGRLVYKSECGLNPTDALIDLLIWVRKEKANER